MSRRTSRVTITSEGRDKGKTFVLTEMSADQAERWAFRAFLGLVQSGAEISESSLSSGMAGLAAIGVQALGGLRWDVLEPLLEEMWTCVQYEHAPGRPLQSVVDGINSQIEEVRTRVELRIALFELHLGFSVPELPPTSGPEQGESAASNTSTPRASLAGWFRAALQR